MCSSSRKYTHSSHSNGSKQLLLLIMALAALVMPLAQARHLHDQVALDYAYDEDSSSSSSSSSAVDGGSSLPQWHANPFHGLAESFASEGSYDSSYDLSLSESSYEEITQAALRAARREFRRQRTRHARSNNLRWFTKSVETPEWENPCGGSYEKDAQSEQERDSSQQGRVIKKKYLIHLRNSTMREYQFVRDNAKLEYSKYHHRQHEYEFLPNMTRPTSEVKLKKWYRHMQTFVGGFAYLGRAEYKYRKGHQQNLGPITVELHELLVSARNMLCELETTINASYPNSNGAKLTQISRETMMDRLKFHTKPDGSQEASERDLRMTKDMYLQYLDNIWKSLRKALRKQQLKNSMERRHHHAAAAAAAATGGASASVSALLNVNTESAESGGGGSNLSGSSES
ncbi:uncharacterized protein upd2 [Drosophila tropicalis]|uniref:uncharacterized protein upd2 n=1 Tax=Drosophila tropicalis TaxID=46794 RepID=UPI0035ABFCC6